MSETLMGTDEATARVRRMVNQKNTGKIEYPSGTNARGSSGGAHVESHACGDRVGNNKGGFAMKPHLGEPQKGRNNAVRKSAMAQAKGEAHAMGDMVGKPKGRAMPPRPMFRGGPKAKGE